MTYDGRARANGESREHVAGRGPAGESARLVPAGSQGASHPGAAGPRAGGAGARKHRLVAVMRAALTGGALVAACAESDSLTGPTETGSTTSASGSGGSTGSGQGGDTSSGGPTTSSTSGSGSGGSGGDGGGTTTVGSGGGGGGTGGGGQGGGGQGGGGGVGGGQGGAGGSGSGGGAPDAGSDSGNCADNIEICNGIDDNCNGQTDEGDPGGGAACDAPALGECKKGTMSCKNGSLKCVPGPIAPEVCDGLDNNCDGNVDEGNPGGGFQCMTNLMGLCGTGITKCDGMNGVICKPNVTPDQLPESCNGLDDDCDGITDEDIAQVGQPCTAPGFLGICQFGTYSCPSSPPFQLTCDHPAPGTVQETCNSKDDDCNGTIDDPALVNNMPCTTGFVGECATGKTQCINGSSNCVADVKPGQKLEICDSVDNDCNGQTDEMNPTPACASQNPNAKFVQSWACMQGTCQIATCQLGNADIDGAPGNGCECATDNYAKSCNQAGQLSVPVGGTVEMVGKIETADGSDWVLFNFASKPVGQPYHPKIELVDSAGMQYAMDVMLDCNNPISCQMGAGSSINVWEQDYSGYQSGAGCCKDNVARVTQVRVRVYRKNADNPTCDSYKVVATHK